MDERTMATTMMRRFVLVVFTITLAFEAAAQLKIRPCFYREVCVPPAFYTSSKSPAPFNAPARFGGTVKRGGETYWIWIKVAEPPTPCTPAQRSDRNAYQYGCTRAIGDPLFVTPARFTEDK